MNKEKKKNHKLLLMLIVISLLAVFPINQNVMADSIDAQCLPDYSTMWMIMTNSTIGQSVTLTSDTVTRIKLQIAKEGSPTSDLHIEIREGWNGTVKRSIDISPSSINELSNDFPYFNDTHWYEWNFTDFSRTQSTYYIILSSTTPWDTNNCYYWRYDTDNIYSGGIARGYYDGSWHDYSSDDCAFIVYGNTSTPNNPPNPPSNPFPANNSENIPINVNISWTCSDPDGDSLTYTVYFSWDSNTPYITENTTYNPHYLGNDDLEYNVTYQWYIVATDEHGLNTSSPIWYFTTTRSESPTAPSLLSPSNGITIANNTPILSWNTSTDPDDNDSNITYTVFLGTTNPPPVVENNQSSTFYDPGTCLLYTSPSPRD